MFDIGFAELLIIGVVALLVIGPERLPGAIRTGSAWLNRFRRSFNEIKHEVQQELHNDAVMRELRESGESLRRETEALRQDFSGPMEDLAKPFANGEQKPWEKSQQKPQEKLQVKPREELRESIEKKFFESDAPASSEPSPDENPDTPR